MPDLFGSIQQFAVCMLIMLGAQLIYATVGFGAGMFAVALMALVLPDLADIVVMLLILTLIAEISVLARSWRHIESRMLVWLIPGLLIGLWLGTKILIAADMSLLKQILGFVVAGTGAYFFYESRTGNQKQDSAGSRPRMFRGAGWFSLPVGLFSGVLGAIFGTGGPPVIVFLRACRLNKTAFRSTIMTYFLSMSILRAGVYSTTGLLTADRALAAVMLLPGTIAGIILGVILHERISERQFGYVVAILLVILGALLAAGLGR
jgi:uncharacterized membrane protein YfcA